MLSPLDYIFEIPDRIICARNKIHNGDQNFKSEVSGGEHFEKPFLNGYLDIYFKFKEKS